LFLIGHYDKDIKLISKLILPPLRAAFVNLHGNSIIPNHAGELFI